uniref:Uncharacterized protein n=1 Tax=Micrurus lemniscatus lemniscatus TaxID=129467 RepID=A0A2D4HJT7_MICLE
MQPTLASLNPAIWQDFNSGENSTSSKNKNGKEWFYPFLSYPSLKKKANCLFHSGKRKEKRNRIGQAISGSLVLRGEQNGTKHRDDVKFIRKGNKQKEIKR